MKVCNHCKLEKLEDDFYFVTKRSKLTIFHICKKCCSSKKVINKEYYRDWELKKKYGISLDDYNKQCSLRNNSCDICSEIVTTLHVDHNHVTGKIRGYLCGSCNRGLGLLKDSTKILQKAKEYLKIHE